MIARISTITIFLVHALVFAASSTAAPGKGDWVLPKNTYLRVENSLGDRSAPRWADQIGIGWPAQVITVDGHWLQISDDGGYTLRGSKRAKYWVCKDDMLNINDNDTPRTYGSEIEGLPPGNNSQLARLHWLRGICWQWKTPERGAEPELASADFEAATCFDQTVADAWLRWGRLLAEANALGGQARWESIFKEAFRQFVFANSRSKAKPVVPSARASGATLKWCAPSVTDCPASKLTAPSGTIATLVGWSDHAPPQLYLEIGKAYQHLADAYWRTSGGKNIADASKAAEDAARKAKDMKRAADDLASEVEQLRKKAWRIRKKAEHVANNADDRVAQEAIKAAARAETIAAEAEADSAKAEAAAAEAKATAATAEAAFLKVERATDKYKEYFRQALTYFQWARHSNLTWYRPPAAEADLFLARTKKELTDEKATKWNGWPLIELSAYDLIRADELYNASIRIYDQFDEAYRGRADALRLLATAPGFRDVDAVRTTLHTDSEFHGLLAGSTTEKRRVLDLAYDSAKIASFLSSDRDAKNLEMRGKIETDRARMIGMNVGLEYFAQAGETFKDAMAYSRWTSYRGDLNEANRDDLNEAIRETEREWYYVLAYFASYNDGLIGRVSDKARRVRKCIDRVSAVRPPLDTRSQLANLLAAARRAIEEIEDFNTTEQEERDDRKAEMRYDEPWFVPLPTRGELVNRNSQTQAWDYIFEALADEVKRQLQNATLKATNPQLYEELERCDRELSGSGAMSGRW